MVNILPFQRTGLLISEIDDFLDKVSEAVMVLEQTILHYLEKGADDSLEERNEQIWAIEERADELRRNIGNVMYSEMLMPDTRGDVLSLLDEVDTTLDDCSHTVVELFMEHPELPPEYNEDFAAMMGEVSKAAEAMLLGARAYFKEPLAVRNHVHKTSFHNKEATNLALKLGRTIFNSDLPLERKRQLRAWILALRDIASHADDVGDQLTILAVKRSY